jgi:uncharacterized protein YcnI
MTSYPHARARISRPARRVLSILTLTAVGLFAGAGIAAAHVTVNPSEVAAGSFSKLTFRVPNESATAGTVGLTVTLPADHPFAYVSVKAVPGWSVVPTKTTLPAPVTEGDITIKEAVTTVTWTADAGTQIGPGEFAEFDISAGPVPAVESLELPTTQNYSDGTVVEWNEPTPASGEEPEHPVPTLTVSPAAEEGAEHGHSDDAVATGSGESTSAATVTAAESPSDSSSTATILAIVSLVVAAAALLVAAVGLRRRPAPVSQTPADQAGRQG